MTEQTYPPLTPLAVMDLHPCYSGDVEAGVWFACEHPERPASYLTLYDWRCGACVMAAAVDVRQNGDRPVVWSQGPDQEVVMLSWLVARSRHFGVGV